MHADAERLQALAECIFERRKENRFPADGEVILVVDAPSGHAEVTADILDFSLHGFRICHEYKGLRRGDRVSVIFSWGDVSVCVAWNKEKNGKIETGFKLF